MREYTRRNRDKINAQRRSRRTEQTLERERAWKSAHPEKVKQYKRTDREKRPADYKRWKQEWAERNREQLKERSRQDYAANKNEILARLETFRKKHPLRFLKQRAEIRSRRRAREAEAFVENVDRDVIYDRDNGTCQLCGRRVSRRHFSLDHIIPIVVGGPHCYLNVQLAHVNCNKRRGHRGQAQMRLTP